MTSLSGVAAGTAPAAITTSTSLAAISAPKPVAQAANPASIGPAATLDISQAALARMKGDRDWRRHVDRLDLIRTTDRPAFAGMTGCHDSPIRTRLRC